MKKRAIRKLPSTWACCNLCLYCFVLISFRLSRFISLNLSAQLICTCASMHIDTTTKTTVKNALGWRLIHVKRFLSTRQVCEKIPACQVGTGLFEIFHGFERGNKYKEGKRKKSDLSSPRFQLHWIAQTLVESSPLQSQPKSGSCPRLSNQRLHRRKKSKNSRGSSNS